MTVREGGKGEGGREGGGRGGPARLPWPVKSARLGSRRLVHLGPVRPVMPI